MNRELNCALIGTGNIASQHAKAIKSVKGVRLVSCFGRTRAKVERFAQQYKLKAYYNYSDLLQDKNINIVDIVLPNCLHADFAIKAAKAGKHIIVEKPIATSLDDADRLIEVCGKTNVTLNVISQYRFNGAFVELRRLIREGILGKIVMVNVSMRWRRPQSYYDISPWRKSYKYAGGGVLMMQAIHLIDILCWCFGEVESVFGEFKTSTHKIEVEDNAIGILRFKNAVLATISATTSSLSNLPNRFEVLGTRGHIVVRDNRIIWEVSSRNSGTETIFQKIKRRTQKIIPIDINFQTRFRNGGIKAQLVEIINALKNNGKGVVSGEEAREILKVVLAMYKSQDLKELIYILED